MPTLSEVFRSIHRLRKMARDLQAEIDRGPIQLKARGTLAAKQAAALQAAKDSIKKKQIDVRDLEVSLKSTHQLTAKYEKQLNEVSDPKAFEALKHEIATSKEKADQLETAILTGMGDVEELIAGLPMFEAAAKKSKTDFDGFEAELKGKHARLAGELKSALADLKTAELEIPAELRIEYNRKAAAMGADCLAAAENGVCGYCRTGMSANQVNQIQKGMYITCTACHRPLYLLDDQA